MIPDIPVDAPVALPKRGTWPKSVHLFDQPSADAILAALAAERPLLVQGEPGAGKSQLARAAAEVLKRAFVSHVVHARSEAQDLQWEYDAVSRLGEAQVLGSVPSKLTPEQRLAPRRFLVPGPLWWTFGWDSARTQNEKHSLRRVSEPSRPDGWRIKDGAVLLIDEIDKAEADLPNSLLETLGNGSFSVPWLDRPVGLTPDVKPPLVIITTNCEREMPRAFVRRCLVLTLDLPQNNLELKALLRARGRQHFAEGDLHDDILDLVAGQLIEDRKRAQDLARPVPGQAEYLDILRALFDARGSDKDAQAATQGFEEHPAPEDEIQEIKLSGTDAFPPCAPGVPLSTSAPTRSEVALTWREGIAPPPEPTETVRVPAPPPRVDPLPPPPPLMPWPRLWPFLRTALGARAERNRVDLRRTIVAASRLKPLRGLPRLVGRRWAPRGQLVLDLSSRLYPFWDDFHDLKDQLQRLRGPTGLEILRMDHGPDGQVQPWEGEAKGWGAPRPYAPPPADAPVLIAGDLDCLGRTSERDPWVRLGRQLAGRGYSPVALTPYPPRWWDPVLAGLYFPVTLDRGAQVPPAPAGPLPWPVRAPDLTAEVRRDAGTRLLLTLLSASIAITPPLTRALRHRLPAGRADVGSEASAWQHPAFVSGDIPLLPGDPAELDVLRCAFADAGTSDQRRDAWELILAQQESTGASVAVRMEERALHATQIGGTDDTAEAFFDRTGAVLRGMRADGSASHAGKLTAWVDRRTGRTHAAIWGLSRASVRLWLEAHPEALEAGATLPPGLEYEIHYALAARGQTLQLQS